MQMGPGSFGHVFFELDPRRFVGVCLGDIAKLFFFYPNMLFNKKTLHVTLVLILFQLQKFENITSTP